MDTGSSFPDLTPALHDGDELLCDSLGQHAASTASALLLARRVENPHESLTATLTKTEWYGNLQSDTTTSRTSLGTDAEKRRHGFEG